MVGHDAPDRTYEVAIVGAGPAGLATAVYAASCPAVPALHEWRADKSLRRVAGHDERHRESGCRLARERPHQRILDAVFDCAFAGLEFIGGEDEIACRMV